jgi:hypothetical protein
MPNERETAEANLALLIRDASNAETRNEKRQAVSALEEFSENTPFSNLGMTADAAIAVTTARTRQAAITRMQDRLNEISDLRDAFKTAKRVAADGEKELFFPRVASALSQTEVLLTSLKEQFDALGAQIDNLKDGVDLDKLKDTAKAVESATAKLRASLDAL